MFSKPQCQNVPDSKLNPSNSSCSSSFHLENLSCSTLLIGVIFQPLIIFMAVFQKPVFAYGNLCWILCCSICASIIHRVKGESLHSFYIVWFYLSWLKYDVNLPKSKGFEEGIYVTWWKVSFLSHCGHSSPRCLPDPQGVDRWLWMWEDSPSSSWFCWLIRRSHPQDTSFINLGLEFTKILIYFYIDTVL